MIKDKLEKLLEHADMSKADYARNTMIGRSAVTKRFKQNTWTIQNLIEIADMCNCNIVFMDKDTNETISQIDITDYEPTKYD